MLTSSTDPPSSASTAVISPDGSACTMLPTVVPRFLITGCATRPSAWLSSGCALARCRVGQHLRVPGQGTDQDVAAGHR